jgi:rhodanese-related sulfurtransferase
MSGTVRVNHLTIDAVKVGLADGSMLIVDVREPHEYAMGRLPGAMLLPLSAFDPGQIPRENGKRVVFACAAGMRSMQALALAQEAGLDLTEHYRGGFKEWAVMGEEVEV